MSWVRLDDRFYSHRKVMSVSLAARWLYVSALCVANQHSNNGVLDQAAQDCLLVAVGRGGSFDALADELVKAGLWERHGVTDFAIHDYLEYQPSDEEQRKERAAAAERQRRFRERRHASHATDNASRNGVTDGVTNAVENATLSLPVPSRPYPSRPGIKEDLAVGHAPPPPTVVLSGQSQARQESRQGALMPEALASHKPAPERSRKPRRARAAQDAPETTARTNPVWEAYAAAFLQRHKTEPTRNLRVNVDLGHFIDRVGSSDAPAVAAFYVRHPAAFYVGQLHPVWALLKDAEKLHAEWRRGRTVTMTEARQREQTSSNAAFRELERRRLAREAAADPQAIPLRVEDDDGNR